MPRITRVLLCVVTIAVLPFAAVKASSQSRLPAARSRVVQAVDDSRVSAISGNTHPLARPEFDRGALADTTPMRRMVLILQRSPEQEAALEQLVDQQQDKTTSAYHQWLTPETFGVAYGPSDRDLSAVTTWLSGHGFSGIQVNAARTFIQFDGTAGMVRSAFRTAMHSYAVRGQQHFANASDPSIPTALSPVIAGIASLNNFPRRAASHKTGNFRHDAATNQTRRLFSQAEQAPDPSFTINQTGQTSYGVTPYDFATIYNVLPLWNASTPIDGTGQTIAIVGQSDINPADFVNFRRLFNLPLGNTATPTGTQYLNIIYNGPNPGVTGDEGEADIDTQWSAAVARGATIDYVVSQGTEVTQGTDLSAIYIVDNNLAPVMSYSYGQCELFLGTSGNAFYKSLWQQAAAQGITVLVASGDSGSAGCDGAGDQGATAGLAVNGLGSTPYNISVGGTDFYMPNGGTAFWNATNSSTTAASAKGYIPEAPWNETCANSVFGSAGTFAGQTPEQVCNNGTAANFGLLSIVGAGGGPSTCIQSNGASSSSCRGGYAKPSWQTGTGVPSDNVRDVPDVSLFASAGFFGAFYVVCQQSTNTNGLPCSLNSPAYDFAGYGGTSVSTPALAGILSLVNQKTGSRQGNANYVLYNLASQQNKAGTACSAISGAPAAGCVFNDITTDTIAMPCVKGTANCTVTNSNDRYGILSGYSSTVGYDLATGLGSVNAANLVNNWSNANFLASATTLSLSPATITHGSQVSATVKVTSTSGTPTGNVSINALVANGSVQAGTLQNGSYSGSLASFPGGAYSVQAHYAGDGIFAPSDSNSVTLTVSPESSATTLGATLYNPSSGSTTSIGNGASLAYGGVLLIRANVVGASGQGAATGNITLTDSGAPLDGGVFRLNSTSNTEDQARGLSPGTHVIAAAYSGDASFNPSNSSTFTINITKAQTISTLQVSEPVLSEAGTLTLTAQIVARGYGAGSQQGFGAAAPGGAVTFSSGGTVLGTAMLTQQTYPTYFSDKGTVAFTLPANQLPIGDNAITVSYGGDANYAPSISAVTTVTVTGATQSVSTTTLSLSATSVAQGTAFTFIATVSPQSPLPTGTVAFLSDGQPAGSSVRLVNGVASASNSSLAITPGTHLITAVYSGDANYKSSVSAPASFTLGNAVLSSTTTVTLTPSAAVQGTAVSVSAAITPVVPVPTGTAQLMLDGNLYGSPVAVTGASINLSLLTDTLQAGSHVVRVNYSGDSSHQPSTSASVTLSILNPVGSFGLSPSTASATAVLGKASNPITLTVTPSGGFHSNITFACTGGLPSGTVCLFSPSSIVPSGAATQTTVLTISPVAAGVQTAKGASSRKPGSPAPIAFAGLLLLLVPLIPRRARRLSFLTVLLALSTLGVLTGCGSGVVVTSIPSPGSLSTGSYAVTLTATGGSTIQTATVNLTIQ
jgi:Pro-kumamolisin, activation domain/Bacterial Ig-like domain (group 3)